MQRTKLFESQMKTKHKGNKQANKQKNLEWRTREKEIFDGLHLKKKSKYLFQASFHDFYQAI